MTDNYNNKLIKALNKSMEKLNTKLQTQLKQLTAAVEHSKKSVQIIHDMTDNFDKFSENVLQANNNAIKTYGDAITEDLITLSDSLDKLEKAHHKQVEDNPQAVNTDAEKFADDIKKKLQNVELTFTHRYKPLSAQSTHSQ